MDFQLISEGFDTKIKGKRKQMKNEKQLPANERKMEGNEMIMKANRQKDKSIFILKHMTDSFGLALASQPGPTKQTA